MMPRRARRPRKPFHASLGFAEGRMPPTFLEGFSAARGRPETSKIEDFRSVKKSYIKHPGARYLQQQSRRGLVQMRLRQSVAP